MSFTKDGSRFGKSTTQIKFPPDGFHVLRFSGTNVFQELVHFDIDDVFNVEHDGIYELVMIPQVCWSSNSNIQTFILSNLPPVKLTLPLKTNVPAP